VHECERTYSGSLKDRYPVRKKAPPFDSYRNEEEPLRHGQGQTQREEMFPFFRAFHKCDQ
jgi:hypothetical protein